MNNDPLLFNLDFSMDPVIGALPTSWMDICIYRQIPGLWIQ